MCVSLAFVQILPHLHTDIQQQPPAAAAAANKNGKSQSEASKSMQATDRPTNKTYQPIQMHRLDVHTWQRTQTLLQYGAWNTACLRIAHTITFVDWENEQCGVRSRLIVLCLLVYSLSNLSRSTAFHVAFFSFIRQRIFTAPSHHTHTHTLLSHCQSECGACA